MSNDKKHTAEEIRAIVDDMIRQAEEMAAAGISPESKNAVDKELSEDELVHAAGGRTLITGEVITYEVIDQYAEILRALKVSPDVLNLFTHEMGFYHVDEHEIVDCSSKYEGAWIDYWVTKQRGKVRQGIEGYSFLDYYSTG